MTISRSVERYELSQSDLFQGRVIIIALDQAHLIMNGESNVAFDKAPKLQAVAAAIINNPKDYKERLALSVASRLPDGQVSSVGSDVAIEVALVDILDGMAGITNAN